VAARAGRSLHPEWLLRLLPSGPDRVHSLPSQGEPAFAAIINTQAWSASRHRLSAAREFTCRRRAG